MNVITLSRGFGILFLLARPLFAQPYVISTVAGGAPPPSPTAATSASIPLPDGVISDSSGNVYFTSDNCVFKIDLSGMLVRVAGTSRAGYSGDGGPATIAQLNAPYGLALDSAGNLYIADSRNNRIRRIASNGTIATVAGTGISGSFGDNGPATLAQLNAPLGIAADSSGNLYIADSFNQRIRKVVPGGNITTVAGDGTCCFAGDNGPATSAQLHQPEGVAVDSSGNLYISDLGNNRIRKVTPAGIITTVAGNGSSGTSGDGGPATSAQLQIAWAVAVDTQGNLLIADSSRIRKVTAGGVISTLAGGQAAGFSGDGGAAAKALLDQPYGVFADSAGNLYIADTGNNRVRKVSSNGNIATIAGDGTHDFSGDNGPATSAQLYNPQAVAVSASGNLYISDYARVRNVSPNGIITTVAGNGIANYFGDNGPAAGAQLSLAEGVAVDALGNIYVADSGSSHRVRKIATNGIINTIAGNGVQGYSGDNGPATSAQLNGPDGLAIDAVGNLYIADSGNARIRKVTPSGTILTIAGNGAQGYAGDGGPATSASLTYPRGVAVDTSGNLYIADFGNNRVRMVSANGIITTIAGSGSGGSSGNGGPATSAAISPQGVAVDASGNLFIADFNNLVWKLSPGGNINIIAGTGSFGYSGDSGSATNAQLSDARGVAIDSSGDVYIADTSNYAIRMLRPVSTLLAIATSSPLPPGSPGATYSQLLSATGGTPPYVWSLTSGALPPGLSLSGSGTISGTLSTAGTSAFTVRVTDSMASTATQSFSISVSAPSIISTSPLPQGTVGLLYSQALSATGGTPPYSWALASGSLPPGLSLSSAGMITGTPTVSGTFAFAVKMADASSVSTTQTFTLAVVAMPPLSRSGVLAHIAAGGGWSTTIYLANPSTSQVAVMLGFHADDGSDLSLAMNVTQQGVSQTLTASSLYAIVNPDATLIIDMGGDLAATATGWVDVLTSGTLSGFAVFRSTQNGTPSEGTSPLQTQITSKIDLPYDNRIGFVTAVALANLTPNIATVTATMWDSSGNQLGVQSITLPANGHMSFLLPAQFAVTAGQEGIVQFQSSAGSLGGLGLRASPEGTFTSIPIL